MTLPTSSFCFFLLPLSQIELCNSLFLPSVASLERVSIFLSRGDGEFREEAPEGGRVLGRIQKSVTKWSLIAWKTAPRSGHSSLVGVRLAGACVSCVPTSASRAHGALRLPGLPGRPYLSAVEPARGPWASPAQVGCPHSGKSGAGRLCLSFTKKLSESWGDFLSSFFLIYPS